MRYEQFCDILNKHIFEGERRKLLKKIADHPERFVGLFRPTKPGAKLLQNLLQSHEIRFGDAIEELIRVLLAEMGFRYLEQRVYNVEGEVLDIDHYFTDGETFYFIEQKIRDDHDSTKKKGQMDNFEEKLDILYDRHGTQLTGIFYFIDPYFHKNETYYRERLDDLKDYYEGVDLKLLYGKGLFDYFGHPQVWDDILGQLRRWKDELPDLPELDFDRDIGMALAEIGPLSRTVWRKLLENNALWQEGVMKVLFSRGETLRYLQARFQQSTKPPDQRLAEILAQRLEQYYA